MVKEKPHPNANIKEKRKDRKAFQQTVGERLFEIRKGIIPTLTQTALGKMLKLNQSAIQRIETGGGTIDTLLVVLQYYLKNNYNLHYILAEDNSKFKLKIGTEEVKDELDNYFEKLD
ncbi:helix-turn-helix domain-containing protein [Adhaeribacter aquaticus]|uniref:helix-turn-helix domain-containing protein n=1 Tax=Adhaeribacter aquaticus TaxID=299567 RepID=UPI0003FBBC59|nr:helix-turn-helix transcriptional regulator [Adhaeribacter aquaticus]